jgi:hypothetical protein
MYAEVGPVGKKENPDLRPAGRRAGETVRAPSARARSRTESALSVRPVPVAPASLAGEETPQLSLPCRANHFLHATGARQEDTDAGPL